MRLSIGMFFCVFFGFGVSHAVQVKHCPATIEVSLSDLNPLPEDEVEIKFWSYVESEDPSKVAVYSALTKLDSMTGQLAIESATNAKCEYRMIGDFGLDQGIMTAVLEGSHAEPHLKIYYHKKLSEFNFAKYIYDIQLSAYGSLSLEAKESSAIIYTEIEKCGWQDCVEEYVKIGTSESIVLAVK